MKQLTVMIKPVSSLCNMRCRYCFYEDISRHREKASYGVMNPDTRKKVLDNIFSRLEKGDSLTVAFQGGEPTLAGPDWFTEFFDEISLLTSPGINVSYAFQTNGLLLDDEWLSIFKKHDVLVGLSLDGPREYNDENRIDSNGKGTYSRIMSVKKSMDHAHISYNVLCTLTNQTARHPQRIWKFVRGNGINYIQFTPCLADIDEHKSKYALTPERYAEFYISLFDMWYEELGRGRFISVKLFDDLLNLLSTGQETACGIAGICRGQIVVESDGTVYPCDFYALDEWRMGNMRQDDIRAMYESPVKEAFCARPRSLPPQCEGCPYFRLCKGGCPRMLNEVYCSAANGFCGHRAFLDTALTRLLKIVQSDISPYHLRSRRYSSTDNPRR